MPVSKASAPANTGDDKPTTAAANTPQAGPTAPEVKAEGTMTHDQHAPEETGQGSTPFPADAREDQVNPSGYHDSQSGRKVTTEGRYLDGTPGEVPAHRIVADDWDTRPSK